jgi:hypothetical protein
MLKNTVENLKQEINILRAYKDWPSSIDLKESSKEHAKS